MALNEKEKLIFRLLTDKIFDKVLSGEVIKTRGNHGGTRSKTIFKIVKKPVTKDILDCPLQKVFSKKIGYYYSFDIGITKEIRFVAQEKHMKKLQELVDTDQIEEIIKKN